MRRALLCLVLLGSPAFADDAKGQNAEGAYGGVQPGESKKPEPGKKMKRAPSKGTLSWLGFETKDGSSDVFFQSVSSFQVSQRVENGVLVVALGLSKMGHNTGLPIDTRFFDTPISRITAKKKGKGIEVRIAFKNAKDAAQGQLQSGAGPDGMYYAHLTFAGGGAEPAAAEPEK